MPTYIPLHDQPPHYSSLPTPSYPRDPSTPRYGSPDFDPSIPFPSAGSNSIMSSEPEGVQQSSSSSRNGGSSNYVPRARDEEGGSGSSRKRSRADEDNDYHPEQSQIQASSQNQHQHQHHQHHHHHYVESRNIPLTGSIFNISPRNPFTTVVGDFILANAAGLDNVEIEVKLGTLMSVPDHQGMTSSRRIRMPTQSEMIVPPDYPLGPFHATMHPQQHRTLNGLLNEAAQQSVTLSPERGRVHFSRSKLTDSFHGGGGRQGKVRVSRNRETGQVVEVVRKRRIADLNVYCPGAAFDWRISVNVEEPYAMPDTPPSLTRDKDRASYRHQVCQVDLTHVMSKENPQAKPVSSFELEIEVLDIPTLLAEGAAGSDRFDEILQNVLDTARMLIKNCDPAPPQ
ncbi:uncharacterized protein IL334_002138 [Kwoniella shivajii]|uniref:mRNA-capping enzyme subunit beta n=1 Tax=Kwoniella shivajii TaxID=564305 RepID=A0ABZ1CVH2_9TREE|nr:hypothetical protein IL334_002138 [Kwoniella shivajii]